MKVCVIGNGNVADKNVKLFSSKHIVSRFAIDDSTATLSSIDLAVVCLQLAYSDVTGKVDVKPLVDISHLLRRFMRKGCTVIIETKVGVGMTRKIFSGFDMHVSYSPCSAMTPKLVGGLDDMSGKLASQFYETIYKGVKLVRSVEIAEAAVMLKCAQRTVLEALINEFSDFCGTVNLNVHDVTDVMGVDMTPSIGRKCDSDSMLAMSSPTNWPVLSTASDRLMSRPTLIYKSIVSKYCNGDYDALHKMSFLVVGVGVEIGSDSIVNSPVMEIVRSLELEGAKVTKYDMFVGDYTELPSTKYNSGDCRFDGILVLYPYMMSKWEEFFPKQTTYFCRH